MVVSKATLVKSIWDALQPMIAGVVIAAIVAIAAWAFHVKDVLIKHADQIDRLKDNDIEFKVNQNKVNDNMTFIMSTLSAMQVGITHLNESINRILDERSDKRN
jgi:hypothetical protein